MITNEQLMGRMWELVSKWLNDIPNDAVVAAQATGFVLDEMAKLQAQLAEFRAVQVRVLRASDWSLAEIAAELGVSRARVAQISEHEAP